MAQRLECPTESELAVFVEKLGQFHSTLPQHEQQLLNAVLLVAAGEECEVQGFGLDRAGVRQAALVAVVALGLGMGGLGAPMAGTAQASELAQHGLVVSNSGGNRAGQVLTTPAGGTPGGPIVTPPSLVFRT